MEYYSAMKRKGFESIVELWMDLESVAQSERSQQEKSKWCMLTYTHTCVEFRKMILMSLFPGQEQRQEVKETDLWMWRGKERVGRSRE